MATNVSGVLFDWDGTLAKVGGFVSSSERLAMQMRNVGLSYYPEEIDVARKAVPELPECPAKRDFLRYYVELLRLLGRNHDEENRCMAKRMYEEVFAALPMPFYPDAEESLRDLAGKGLRLGIISNTGPKTGVAIREKVARYISVRHVITSGEVGVHKPAKSIFRLGASRLHIGRGRRIYIGDNLKVDAIGAVENGEYHWGLWIDREGNAEMGTLPPRVGRIVSLAEITRYI
jgi:HAD superfamily hydrolase (TIGR01549 family)